MATTPVRRSAAADASPGSRWFTASGIRFHARVVEPPAPNGHLPVVLVHGLGASSRYVAPTLLALGRSRAAYAPDLPGFGLTPGPARALDVPALADALAACLEGAGIRRAALVGASFGCQVVVDCAVRHPALVDALVLVAPTIDRRGRTAGRQLARAATDALLEPPGLAPVLLRDLVDTGPARIASTLSIALADPIEAKLPNVRQPALVIRGEHDPVVPQRWAEEVAELLPNGRLLVMQGAAHGVNFSDGPRLAAVIAAFLDARRSAG